MGITGLLPFLEKSSKKSNISQFSEGTVAIDSYCWLHKGAFSCADKIVMGQPTDAYIKYCMKYVNMLLDLKIKPILVFDGRHLQAKAETEVKRRETRKINRKKGAELMRMGNTAEGRNLLRRSLDITHKMALELIKECQQINVDCIVAPYEADAQLAYLNISGIADVVITEDSDLTLFGCKKVFFKMDLNGNGVLVEQERLHIAMGIQPEHFNMDMFRYMCILSGCDYLASLPGIGLMKACKFVKKLSDCDIIKALPRIGAYLNMKSLVVTKEYIDSFLKADITFKHQLVYCPLQRKQVRLYPVSSSITQDQLKFAGEEIKDEHLAWQIALGNNDPFTFEKLHDFDPDVVNNAKQKTSSWVKSPNSSHKSIWSKSFDINARQVTNQQTSKNKILQIPNSTGSVAVLKSNIMKIPIKRSYEEDDEISDKEFLQMYNIGTSEEKKTGTLNSSITEDKSSSSKEQTSPIVSRGRVNPFKKQNEESPNYLNRGRKKCMLRFKPTIIDDAVITQSKFFASIGETKNEKADQVHLDKNESNGVNSEKKMIVDDEKLESSAERESQKENCEGTMYVDQNATSMDSEKKESQEDNSTDAMRVDLNNCSMDVSYSDSIDLLNVHDSDLNNKKSWNFNNANPEKYDEDEYFSTEEILPQSNFFQWTNSKTNVQRVANSNDKSQRLKKRLSISKQSSTKKIAKKVEPMPGQSLLNQFGFKKRTVIKY